MLDMNKNRQLMKELENVVASELDRIQLERHLAQEEAAKINRRQTMMAVGAGILTVIGLSAFGYYINK